MVERERGEGEARALASGPGQQQQQEGAAEGERVEKEGDEREEEDRDDEAVEWSEIRLAIEELSPAAHLKRVDGDGKAAASSLPTLRFLALSHLLVRVLDKIGPTMAVLRLDVQRNIERLQELYLLDPATYSTLTGIVEKEVKEGTARKVDSCARAILWLAR
ncbi:uncharacterized protein LOC100276602 [Zea mays]|nr:uncharacterized protein LOC100276602 [Zea mays]|eukprot:NP_001143823.2 uncharacterized protein LOC100276602 [Zea mays]